MPQTREERNAKQREWYQSNKEKRREYMRLWSLEHPDYWREQHELHKEQRNVRARANSKVYYQTHKHKQQCLNRQRDKVKRAVYWSLYRQTHRQELREAWYRREAKKKGVTTEKIDVELIRQRDRKRCCICGAKVSREDFSLDHVIPLSLGGPHIMQNLRLAHRQCNSRRGVARIPVQMLLI